MVVYLILSAHVAFNAFILAEAPMQRARRLRAVIYACLYVFGHVYNFIAHIAFATVGFLVVIYN